MKWLKYLSKICIAILILICTFKSEDVYANSEEQWDNGYLYFGQYEQDNNSSKREPIKWDILECKNGQLYIMSQQILEVRPYHTVLNKEIIWRDSDIRFWLNGMGAYENNSFLTNAFATGEEDNVVESNLKNGTVTTDKVFLLSKEEAKNPQYGFSQKTEATDSRVATNTAYVGAKEYRNASGSGDIWWLRTQAQFDGCETVVDAKGNIVSGIMGYEANFYAGIRPALRLDLSNVLMVSLANGGKGTEGTIGELIKLGNAGLEECKLTLKTGENSLNIKEHSFTKKAGETIGITYDNSVTGTEHFISCILSDKSGIPLYYSRLKKVYTKEETNGQVEFTLPSDLGSGNYQLKLFTEQCNGNYLTDYTNHPVDIEIKITSTQTEGSGGNSGSVIGGVAPEVPEPVEKEMVVTNKDGSKEITNKKKWDSDLLIIIETLTIIKDKEEKTTKTIEKKEIIDKNTEEAVESTKTKDSTGKILSFGLDVKLNSGVIENKKDVTDIRLNFPIDLLERSNPANEKAVVTIKLPEEMLIKMLKDQESNEIGINLEIPQKLGIENGYDIKNILLPKRVLETSKLKDKTIGCNITGSDRKTYSWLFEKNLLKFSKRKINDVNLWITTENTIKKNIGKGVLIKFAHSGILPATAKIDINISPEMNKNGIKANEKAYLYYVGSDGEDLISQPRNVYNVSNTGRVKINLTHCSDYIILPKEPKSKVVVTLPEQIKVSTSKKVLYVSEPGKKTVAVEIKMPVTLKKVESFSKKPKDVGVCEVKYTYNSSDSKIATINSKGNVTAKKKGKVKITTTANLADGQKKIFNLVLTIK